MRTRLTVLLSLAILPLAALASAANDAACETLYMKKPEGQQDLAEFIAKAYADWRAKNPGARPNDCYTVKLVSEAQQRELGISESDRTWIAWPIGF